MNTISPQPFGPRLGGVKVQAKSVLGDRAFETTSDADGSFAFPELIGTYEIRAERSPWIALQPDQPVTPPAGGCAIQNIGMAAPNSIEGYVRDARRRPLGSIKVTATAGVWGDSPYSDKSGKYGFERLPPGEYTIEAPALHKKTQAKLNVDSRLSLDLKQTQVVIASAEPFMKSLFLSPTH